MLRFDNAVDQALDILFPRSCIGCGRIGSYLCALCESRLPRVIPPVCPRCGRPQASDILCPACAQTTGTISSIRSPFRFEGAARKAIHQLKYHNLRAIAPTLAEYMVACLDETGYKPDLIVPVPLHSTRLHHRGYNQSSLLAHEVGKKTGIPVSSDSLSRIREGTSQVRTSSIEERRQNVLDAFACNILLISDKRVLLIDDVCTTGATLESCALSLKGAGAIEIQGLTVAREI